MSEQKPIHEVKAIVCRAPRQDRVEAQIWGMIPKNVCIIEDPQEHSDLHHSEMEEVYNHQGLHRAVRPAKMSIGGEGPWSGT